jgi:hypothetical protein
LNSIVASTARSSRTLMGSRSLLVTARGAWKDRMRRSRDPGPAPAMFRSSSLPSSLSVSLSSATMLESRGLRGEREWEHEGARGSVREGVREHEGA